MYLFYMKVGVISFKNKLICFSYTYKYNDKIILKISNTNFVVNMKYWFNLFIGSSWYLTAYVAKIRLVNKKKEIVYVWLKSNSLNPVQSQQIKSETLRQSDYLHVHACFSWRRHVHHLRHRDFHRLLFVFSLSFTLTKHLT